MKKIIILIVLLFFSVNSAIGACSLTGGACAIDDLNTKQTPKQQIKNDKKNKKVKNKKTNIQKPSNLNKQKQYGKNN